VNFSELPRFWLCRVFTAHLVIAVSFCRFGIVPPEVIREGQRNGAGFTDGESLYEAYLSFISVEYPEEKETCLDESVYVVIKGNMGRHRSSL